MTEVAGHPIGAGEIDLFVAAVMKNINAGMFQVAIHNADAADILRHTFYSGDRAAYSPRDKADPHSGIACFIKFMHHLRIFKTIELAEDRRFFPLAGILDLAVNHLLKLLAHIERSDEQIFELYRPFLFSQDAEHFVCFFCDLLMAREKTKIGIDLCCFFVEVAGAEIDIPLLLIIFHSRYDTEFAMNLESREAIEYLHSRALKFACPKEI